MSTAPVGATAPGLHRGVSYDDYSAWPGINHSILKHFARSPAHARAELLNPKDATEACERGHHCHAAILEPERFELDYVPAPRFDKRTKDGKAGWADFQVANKGRAVILQDEYDLAIRLRDAVHAHPTARELLTAPGHTEVSTLWIDAGTGVPCKARLDRLTSLHGWPVVGDLKTTKNAARNAFQRDVYFFRYYTQAAFYLDGCNTLAPHPRKFMFVCVETEPPHAVAVYELEDDAIALGRDDYQKWLASYAQCLETGEWPAYGDGADYVSVPAWAFREVSE